MVVISIHIPGNGWFYNNKTQFPFKCFLLHGILVGKNNMQNYVFGFVFDQVKETDNFCSFPALGKICWEYFNLFPFLLNS